MGMWLFVTVQMLLSCSTASAQAEHEAVCTNIFEEAVRLVKGMLGLGEMASGPGCVPCLILGESCHAFDLYLLRCHISWLDFVMLQPFPSSNFLGISNRFIIMSQVN